MKTVLKRTFSLLLVMIMLVSVLPVAVSAADYKEVGSAVVATATADTTLGELFAAEKSGAGAAFEFAKATYIPDGEVDAVTVDVDDNTATPIKANTQVTFNFWVHVKKITVTIIKDGQTVVNGVELETDTAKTVGELLTQYSVSDTGCVVSPSKDTTVNPDDSVTITVTTDNSKEITLHYVDGNGQDKTAYVWTNLNNQLDTLPNPDNVANNASFIGWYDSLYNTTGEMLSVGTNVRGDEFYAHYVTNNNNERDTVKIYGVVYVGGAYKTTVGPLVTDDAVFRGTNTLNLLNNKLDSVVAALNNTNYGIGNGYELENTVVFYDDQGLTDKISQTDTVKSNDNYYVRVNYTGDEEVQIYVHTSKTNTIARTITLKTYAPGEIITKSIVNAAVKKYYNVSNSNIFMYEEDSWKQIVAGNTTTDQDTEIEVLRGQDTKIHVYLKGATNNSDNPKTGDIILMVVTVLAVSGTALAVIYFVSKKKKSK